MKKFSYSKILMIEKFRPLLILSAALTLPGSLSAQPFKLEASEIQGPDVAARTAEGRKPPVNALGAPIRDAEGREINYGPAELAPIETMAETKSPANVAPQGFVPTVLGSPPFWHYSILGSGIGASNIIIGPVPTDGGAPEIILGGNSNSNYDPDDFWQVIRRNATTGNYDHLFVSQIYTAGVKRIAVADLASDSQPEIVVMLADGRIYFYDFATRGELGYVDTRINGLAGLNLTDLDGDGFAELIVTTANDLFVLDSSGTLLWQLAGAGGSDVVAGQMDNDPAIEIAATKGVVVDAATRTAQWTLRLSLGLHVKLAPLPGASYKQLILAEWYRVRAYDVSAQQVRWSIPLSHDVGAIEVADLDNDGMPELVIGDNQFGSVHVHDLITQAMKWQTNNPEHGVTDLAVGDVENDGVVDLVWGAGWTSSAPDYLYVSSTTGNHAIKWQSLDLWGPFVGPLLGDLDGDGQPELVVCTRSGAGYDARRVLVFDIATLALRGMSAPIPGYNQYTQAHDLKLSDLEGDGRMEIVVAGRAGETGLIEIYGFDSSNTFTRKWTNTTRPLSSPFTFVEVADLDGNGTPEIIAGNTVTSTGSPGVKLYIYDYPSGINPWSSLLATSFREMTGLVVEDLDGDGTREIAALVSTGDLYTFDGLTRELENVVPQSGGRILSRRSPSGLIYGDFPGVGHFFKYSGQSYAEVFSRKLGSGTLYGLNVLANGGLWTGSGGALTLRVPPSYDSVEWQSPPFGTGFGRSVATDYRNGQTRVFSSASHAVAGFTYQSSQPPTARAFGVR
ncbi:MAG TPA: FG-GAP-like repeat-containing protein [Chthoniobacterales bacterium]|nr:FG-GAP-like repeat-containing protein [Chthoniobacterales bacterium]